MSGEKRAPRRKIHPLRDALLASLITFATSAIGLAIIYFKARDAQLQAVRLELLQLATTTAAQVDGDLHARLVSPDQVDGPDYRRAVEPLVRMHRASRDVRYVYTGILRDGHVYWVLDTDRYYHVPDNDEPPDPMFKEYPGTDPDLMRAFRLQRPEVNAEPVVEVEHTYVSAFAPIRDHSGKMVALLGIDMVLDSLDERLASVRHAFLIALLAVFLLSIGAGATAMKMRAFASGVVKAMRGARLDAERLAAEARSHADAAQAAARAKASFLAMMSHEIRTPMNGILGVADLLRVQSPTPEQKKLIDILSSSGNSLLRIINDVLDFSKMEAERLELRPRPFETRVLIDELQHILGTPALQKGVSFVVDADPALPAVLSGDQQRLSQVLLNLGTNAVKFTDVGEVRMQIRVLAADGDKVRLEFLVSDTGIGMDAAAMGRIFTPFTQVAEARRHRSGTGLGLVIAQKLVALMGGRIGVRSEVGAGSVFSFTLELPVARSPGETHTVAALRLESLSVLVAEDNAVNQTIVAAMLRQLGHRSTVANNGREALAALAREDFDLVLMDYHMPDMDGLEATRALRAGGFGVRDARIPVIALTANAMEGDREICIAAGMDDFLPKPVTIAALREAIERMRGATAKNAAA
jgi:signal transduction histidine kinase/ActR/RegA family two-component response regulator